MEQSTHPHRKRQEVVKPAPESELDRWISEHDGVLRVRSAWKPWWAVSLTGAAGAFVTFGAVFLSALFAMLTLVAEQPLFIVPTVLALFGALIVGMLSTTSMLTLAAANTHLAITREGWRQQHLLAPGLQSVEHVALTGDVGGPIQLHLEGKRWRTILDKVPAPEGSGPTYPTFVAIAQRVARTLGLPLRNELDHEGWMRWHTDLSFRVLTRFNRLRNQNREEHTWHALQALEPTKLERTHSGMKTSRWTMDQRHLEDRKWKVANHAILAVDVHFETHVDPENGYTTYTGQFWVLTSDRIVRMAERSVTKDSALMMLGEAHYIREALRAISPPQDRGSSADIPAELGVLGPSRSL